jgi:hypothetical protein
MSIDRVVEGLVALDPQPRGRRWRSLSYCVIDAVWSVSALYDEVVVPLVRRVAERTGDLRPAVDAGEALPPDPLPLPQLRQRYPTVAALRADTNGQRTSTRSGIEKADAVLRYAAVLVEHDVHDLAAVELLMTELPRWQAVDRALGPIPGDGLDGIRRGYLWMLAGADELSKPDRMILRWLARHGCTATPAEARDLLRRAAEQASARLGRPVTPWMADHAVWAAERGRLQRRGTAIEFDVDGWPPLKNEASSLFSARHSHAERVRKLLVAAAEAVALDGWNRVADDVALEVTVRSPTPRPRGDATNFLGGIGDVLQGRPVSDALDLSHLADLDAVALFDDDQQIQRIAYNVVVGPGPSYTVRVTVL